MRNAPIRTTVITPTFKARYFETCRCSIVNQTTPVQHIVIDGDSGHSWTDAIRRILGPQDVFVSEPDSGIYQAINKGIALARTPIVGLLNSDDYFASRHTIEYIEKAFERNSVDVVFGDLQYVTEKGRVVRQWNSNPFVRRSLSLGWMPPHPTMFVARSVFQSLGLYDEHYRIAGDYELILRLFSKRGIRTMYIPTVLTCMRLGGASNRNITQIVRKWREDVRAMRTHGYNPLIALPAKNARKLSQFIAPRSTSVRASAIEPNAMGYTSSLSINTVPRD